MSRRFGKVAVLKGGVSSERPVSLRSGAAIAQGLREEGYAVEEVDVQSEELSLPEGTEAVFIALHGRYGEDGTVQRQLQKMGLPFTGSGAESSRISFDKVLTRGALSARGIPVPPGEVICAAEDRTLPVPLVVKPPREGSSVGCHLVFDEAGWLAAYADAAQFGDTLLVEEYIEGRELTVGILDGEVLPVVEIKPKAKWYDFRAKYESGDTEYSVPAELEATVTEELQALALATFEALDAEGFGRVDFRLSPDGKPYVLEFNAIPGFTESSLLPKAAAAAGVGFSVLCGRIMETAHL